MIILTLSTPAIFVYQMFLLTILLNLVAISVFYWELKHLEDACLQPVNCGISLGSTQTLRPKHGPPTTRPSSPHISCIPHNFSAHGHKPPVRPIALTTRLSSSLPDQGPAAPLLPPTAPSCPCHPLVGTTNSKATSSSEASVATSKTISTYDASK
jgi:hypothetical protein